jgi:hypothetical protein
MFPGIAYSGLEFFDTISHAFSYVYSKPWRMIAYNLLAAAYGAACYLFVRFFAFLMLASTHSFLRTAIWTRNAEGVNKLETLWPQPSFMDLSQVAAAPANWTESASAFLIHLSVLLIVGLLVSFIISFYFSANTIIYALIRFKVDKTPFDDVYTGFGEHIE